MPPLVVITERLDAEPAEWLTRHAEVAVCPHDDAGALAPLLARAEGLVIRTYTRVDDAMLVQAPRLKVVGRAGVGLENVDVQACRRRGVQVVYTPDANTQAVVEFTLGLILDALRPRVSLAGYTPPEEFHRLRAVEVGKQLDRLTLGILGFGRIGKRLGRVAHAIGMNLRVNDLLPEAELRKSVAFPFEFVDKPTLYAGCDVLSVHVDGRASNRHLINAAALARLRPHCLFVNASRGMVVDAAALADWARRVAPQGGQAVLDVHDPEPPPPDYPLYHLPNVRLLPHLASRTEEGMANMSWVVRDVVAVLDGQRPQYPAPSSPLPPGEVGREAAG
jgi:D-3-phosphoglycerate dehydrogenase / 2-oxoglutarate reductase